MTRRLTMNKLASIFAALTLAAAPSLATTKNLVAKATSVTIGANTITMWGYGEGTDCTASVTVPGPRLTVTDTTLTITLKNCLTVPTSIMIPGLSPSSPPVPVSFTPAGDTRPRVRSLVPETTVNGTNTYSWTVAKPGTYLYQSGTHMQVQVQMGLYGAVTKDASAGFAYPGVSYASEAVLFYSEIDPALHAAVASGTYGTPTGPTSTFNYKPKYFLVNGSASGNTALNGFQANTRVLLRFLNAAIDVHAPELNKSYLSLVAEDGNLYPFPKTQYEVHLAPLKTKDAIWMPPAAGDYVVYDRALGLSTNGAVGGGMVAKLTVAGGGGGSGAPVAANDTYTVAEDNTLSVAAPGVLGNDTGTGTLSAILVSGVSHGALSLNANGGFTYSPSANYNGSDQFTYKANNGFDSNVATVTITVTPVNDPPVAVNDAASAFTNTATTINVLANDTDPEGNTLTVASLSAVSPAGAGTVTGNGATSVTFTAAASFAGTATFTYRAFDGALNSSTAATVTVTVTNRPPVANNDTATTVRNNPVTINLVANDTDPDNNLAVNTVVILTQPANGTVTNNGNGTVTYRRQGSFTGTVTFTYNVKDAVGAVSNTATVTVTVTN